MARERRVATLKSKRGDELTDEVVEALADEAERGYDLENAERVPVGRPSLAGGGGGPSPRVNVRVPDETYEALRRQAHEESRTVSDLAREALAQYVHGRPGR
jgi:CRISPR-associated endonuclease/helicase Cas3